MSHSLVAATFLGVPTFHVTKTKSDQKWSDYDITVMSFAWQGKLCLALGLSSFGDVDNCMSN